MSRRDTRLKSAGAEFLVLGQLLIQDIPAYKTYTNMPGYDVVAINPDKNSAARISVKSRWNTDATGFIIGNFACDFVVVVKLNCGTSKDPKKIKLPEFFVLPVKVVKRLPRSNWNRIEFRRIQNFQNYIDRWDLINKFLLKSRSRRKQAVADRL